MRIQNYLILLFFILVSCKSSVINIGLNSIGAYEDKIQLRKWNYKDKNVVFIPMHHIGTESFYKNVKDNVDSLTNEGYYFLYEKVNLDRNDPVIMHKMRKIFRLPLTKSNSGYKKMLDSLYPNIKYKKILVDQISYEKLALNNTNSERADVDSKQIVNFYENKYGDVKLTNCDLDSSVYEVYTKCKEENKIPKKQSNDALINFRNDFVAKKVVESPHRKVAIIYGEEHIEGILKALSEKDNN